MELARTGDPRCRVEVAENGNAEDIGLAVQALSGRRARSPDLPAVEQVPTGPLDQTGR